LEVNARMADFIDLFSARAAAYARFRPTYPAAMIEYLARLAPSRRLVWDCGTGNGQAAVLLADHFERVIGTDASPKQLAEATPHPRVEYRQAVAESSGLATASVDLVTVAQALHWFPIDAFYAEVERVLVPGGWLAVWTYSLVRISPEVDAVVDHFYTERVGRYWLPERAHVDAGYKTLSFPFPEEPNGPWASEVELDRNALVGYVSTWSATSRCHAATGIDPVPELEAALEPVWPDASAKLRARWPIGLRAGRRPAVL
jgi:SAM-dependent methyltransferase